MARAAALLASARAGAALRVAFVGNSYTFCDGTGGNKGYYNDLPGTFASLAKEGGVAVETGKVTPGQSSLFDHANMSYPCDCVRWSDHRHCAQWKSCGEETQELLQDSKGWDFVVLQENSQIPGEADGNDHGVKRSVKALKNTFAPLIDTAGAQAVLYQTWGYRLGDTDWDAGYLDFPTMNQMVADGYVKYAAALKAGSTSAKDPVIAPMGKAWELAYNWTGRDASVSSRFTCLYSDTGRSPPHDDGDALQPRAADPVPGVPPCDPDWWGQRGHPGYFGTYLNGCVLYAQLLQKSPVGLQWAPQGISAELRDWAQLIAQWAVSGVRPDALPAPAPPATPAPGCSCEQMYPYCFSIGEGHDNSCYNDKYDEDSTHHCHGKCTSDYFPPPLPPAPAPGPAPVPPAPVPPAPVPPATPPPSPTCAKCVSGACCDPTSGQLCPGQVPCCDCGGAACQC